MIGPEEGAMSGVNGNGILEHPRLVDKRGPRWNNKSKCVSATCMVFLSGLLAAGIPPRAFAQSTARVSGLIHDQSASLELGQSVQKVEVKATASNLITTESGAKTEVLTAGQIQNLSTMGRNAMELLGLLAGVVDQGFDPSRGSNLNQGIAKFSFNGLRYDQNDYHIDGARGIEPGGFSSLFIVPNMDMIQEFSVKTSNVEADQGRSPVNIDAVTKSGGRDYHGAVFYYGRNAALNANDFSNNLAGIPKPASKFNYLGFNLGGPVRIPGTNFNKNRDKLFFFVGMEWQRQLPDPGTQLVTVPTAKMRTGDFSELLNS